MIGGWAWMAMNRKLALRNFLMAAGLVLLSAGMTLVFLLYVLFVRSLPR